MDTATYSPIPTRSTWTVLKHLYDSTYEVDSLYGTEMKKLLSKVSEEEIITALRVLREVGYNIELSFLPGEDTTTHISQLIYIRIVNEETLDECENQLAPSEKEKKKIHKLQWRIAEHLQKSGEALWGAPCWIID